MNESDKHLGPATPHLLRRPHPYIIEVTITGGERERESCMQYNSSVSPSRLEKRRRSKSAMPIYMLSVSTNFIGVKYNISI